MPDPPVNINGTAANAVVLQLFHVTVCCSGDSVARRIAGGAPDRPARGTDVMCARSDQPIMPSDRKRSGGAAISSMIRKVEAGFPKKIMLHQKVSAPTDSIETIGAVVVGRRERSKEACMPYTFTLTATIPATPVEIYEAWLDSIGHSEMTGGEATMSEEVGAEVTAWDGYISGRNLELVPGERIVQSWRTTEFGDGDEDSIITVVLQGVDDGTLLTLEHSNVPDQHRSYEEGGWQSNYFEPMVAYFSEIKADIAEPTPYRTPSTTVPKKAAKPRARSGSKNAAGNKKTAGTKPAAKKRAGAARRTASAGAAKRAAPRAKSAPKKKPAKGKAKARASAARPRAKSSARRTAPRRRR